MVPLDQAEQAQPGRHPDPAPAVPATIGAPKVRRRSITEEAVAIAGDRPQNPELELNPAHPTATTGTVRYPDRPIGRSAVAARPR
jgi:hypothetical protein